MQKKEVKIWLKAIGKNRDWLAEQCKTGKRIVDSWLSTSRAIPSHAQAMISLLMEQYPAAGNAPATYPSAAEKMLRCLHL